MSDRIVQDREQPALFLHIGNNETTIGIKFLAENYAVGMFEP